MQQVTKVFLVTTTTAPLAGTWEFRESPKGGTSSIVVFVERSWVAKQTIVNEQVQLFIQTFTGCTCLTTTTGANNSVAKQHGCQFSGSC